MNRVLWLWPLSLLSEPKKNTKHISSRPESSLVKILSPSPQPTLSRAESVHSVNIKLSKSLKKHHFFLTNIRKEGGRLGDLFVKKNYHVSKSYSSHLEQFLRIFFKGGEGPKARPSGEGSQARPFWTPLPPLGVSFFNFSESDFLKIKLRWFFVRQGLTFVRKKWCF